MFPRDKPDKDGVRAAPAPITLIGGLPVRCGLRGAALVDDDRFDPLCEERCDWTPLVRDGHGTISIV